MALLSVVFDGLVIRLGDGLVILWVIALLSVVCDVLVIRWGMALLSVVFMAVLSVWKLTLLSVVRSPCCLSSVV